MAGMYLSINVQRSDEKDHAQVEKAARKEFSAEADRRGFKVPKADEGKGIREPEVTVNGGIVRVEGQVEPK